ncbi:hypothetical protein DPMN_136712 [Dreissena polymorpha]|uniref:Uncharacterized protein n=1 Tax=Dreissena polymorpha TaxID=45954 RepID=A0A9D4G0C4_DREPO|nr:hypothetical protein DPMN_136712 [Dreissena polymorpha]
MSLNGSHRVHSAEDFQERFVERAQCRGREHRINSERGMEFGAQNGRIEYGKVWDVE